VQAKDVGDFGGTDVFRLPAVTIADAVYKVPEPVSGAFLEVTRAEVGITFLEYVTAYG